MALARITIDGTGVAFSALPVTVHCKAAAKFGILAA
jgi:hypothetical protein